MLSSAEVVNVVRFLSIQDVRDLAGMIKSQGKTRLDVIHRCLSSKRARRALAEYVYDDCSTPRHQGIDAASDMSLSPPPAPARPRPKCMRRLDFDAWATVA